MTTKQPVSPYYPPRARWYSRILTGTRNPLRRVQWDRLRPVTEISVAGFLASLALPGLAWLLSGRRLVGWLFLTAYALAALVSVAALGYPAGTIGYGLAISLHATSIVFLEGAWLKDSRLRVRVALAFCTLVAVWALVYAPLLGFAERHWVVPLRVGERVLIVRTGFSPATLRRGDWVAFRTRSDVSHAGEENVVFQSAGWGVDRVLGLPGDRVRFTPEGVLVNGQPGPLAPYMPVAGELVVPRKVWFIWPSFDIRGGGRATREAISGALLRAAMVSEEQIIGRPFQHWCLRRQWL
jgi:signal peptidase I